MRNVWIIIYLMGIVFVSFIGDPHFVLENFTPWVPLGILRMPYDVIVLALFSIAVYFWVYRLNTQKKTSFIM